MSSVVNVVGAICLNQVGLAFTLAHPTVLVNLVRCTISESHEDAISERDNALLIGAGIDELSRHHPTLRPIILQGVLDMLRQTCKEGETFTPEAADAAQYASTASDIETTTPPPSNQNLVKLAKIFKVSSKRIL
jgi:E3 ubiquitin-protein ligase HUWE1